MNPMIVHRAKAIKSFITPVSVKIRIQKVTNKVKMLPFVIKVD